MSRHRSIRFTEQMETRLAAICKTKKVSFSAAVRFALERGIAAMESDAGPTPTPAPAPSPAIRRRILSRGVG